MQNEIQKAILEAFSLGWSVGNHEQKNAPICYEELKRQCAFAFEQRDELVAKFAGTVEVKEPVKEP